MPCALQKNLPVFYESPLGIAAESRSCRGCVTRHSTRRGHSGTSGLNRVGSTGLCLKRIEGCSLGWYLPSDRRYSPQKQNFHRVELNEFDWSFHFD